MVCIINPFLMVSGKSSRGDLFSVSNLGATRGVTVNMC